MQLAYLGLCALGYSSVVRLASACFQYGETCSVPSLGSLVGGCQRCRRKTIVMHRAFPLITDRAAQKRVRTEETNFFNRRKEIFPHFHVIHCDKTDKQARTLSPFVVAKCLTNTLGAGYKVTKMASGDLLLEVQDKQQFERLNDLATFGDIPITVTPHRSMNSVHGVVSDDDLIELSETELLEGWKDQNVTNVQRITIRRDNKQIPTKHLILTFASSDLPDTIQTGYTKIAVRAYIPNPRRCFQCQRYGHGSQSCRGRQTCAQCGVEGHLSETCKEAPHCVNCDGNHPAYSRSCSHWKKEKEIITLKVKENITFKEARKRVSPFYGSTYADATRQGAALHQTPPPARLARRELSAVASAPVVEAAKVALPPRNSAASVASTSFGSSQGSSEVKEVPSTSVLVESKASSLGAKPVHRSHRSLERVPCASDEAMDTTACDKAQGAPGERKGSLGRSKKDKVPVTGPAKGPVK